MNRPPMSDEESLAGPACCRISRMPVSASPQWCWVSPERLYGLRVTRIGTRIISIESWGHVNLDHARRGWSVYRKAQAAAPEAGRPVIVIDDHSRIRAATFNARAFLAQQLKRQSDWLGYIAYGETPVFQLALNLAQRMNLFDFKIQVAADYDCAIRTALAWQADDARNSTRDLPDGAGHGTPGADRVRDNAMGASASPQAPALEEHARDLFRHVGRLNLNRYGVVAVEDDRPANHPFRPIYDALGMIHADMNRILSRYQRNRLRLKRQEQALLAKNAALAETQTTLEILLRTRREERYKHNARADQRFTDLLLPIVEGLAGTRMNAAQRRQVECLRDIIANIGCMVVPNPRFGELKLTPRETLTAYLVARGCTTREAAAVMNAAPRTVEHYRAGLRRKAGLAGTGQRLRRWLNHPHDKPAAAGLEQP
ncbi:MAG: hypothetical protein QNI97_00950 [Desulfobacterales bacterium]|nr:hypothetical protein [Desulfobacterales bacterium]